MVDDEDAEVASQFLWHTIISPTNRYAATTVDSRPVMLHRLLLQAGDDQLIDHRNGNGLDCRRFNLRFASPAQNQWNRRSSNPLGKGVSIRGHRFVAQITIAGVNTYLGRFITPEEAHEAYRAAAERHYGDFMCTEPIARSEPLANKEVKRSSNPLGMGVTWHKGKGKFQARITLAGIRIWVGTFQTAEEARTALLKYACHQS